MKMLVIKTAVILISNIWNGIPKDSITDAYGEWYTYRINNSQYISTYWTDDDPTVVVEDYHILSDGRWAVDEYEYEIATDTFTAYHEETFGRVTDIDKEYWTFGYELNY